MSDSPIDRRWLPLNALRAFEGVAKHGSFTAAANALLISQSALSRHVIALEKLLGQQLFERRPHALVLTKAGQYLLPAIMKSFDRLEYALDDVRNDVALVMYKGTPIIISAFTWENKDQRWSHDNAAEILIASMARLIAEQWAPTAAPAPAK